MVDFDYYVNEYLGELLPESAFNAYAKRAKAVLKRLCHDYVVSGGEEEKAMAVCAMAEELYRCAGRLGLAGATVGAVRVQYQNLSDRQLLSRLYGKAAIYLDIYRGRYAL